jgi:hypothetical protein
VPVPSTVFSIVVRLAVTVRVTGYCAEALLTSRRPNHHTPAPTAPITAAAATARTHRRVRLQTCSMFSLTATTTTTRRT